mgnify:CR=1 FL=1
MKVYGYRFAKLNNHLQKVLAKRIIRTFISN